MMLACWPRRSCSANSSSICLGRRRPTRKAWSLLMNLMAMTGVAALGGMALRML
jgi:hypothetical protein